MTRWKDGTLDLGRLGKVRSVGTRYGWICKWYNMAFTHPFIIASSGKTQDDARVKAISWLRRALKQAAKRVEGKVTCT